MWDLLDLAKKILYSAFVKQFFLAGKSSRRINEMTVANFIRVVYIVAAKRIKSTPAEF
jgi:hypothetical protein